MSRTTWLALLLAASHLLTVIVTCPASQHTPLDAVAAAPVGPVSHSLPSEGGDEMHAKHHRAEHDSSGHDTGKEAPPCHAPSSALKAPCPCGCDGSAPVARSGLFGVGDMMLVEEAELSADGRPLHSAARVLLLPIARPLQIDHIPIFA
ncbi:MAG: hypothetical protein JRG96_03160 [Deltaproteobacteria bacterium]|nr:hypothetical protein [Deltaproteobacteria bacterium]